MKTNKLKILRDKFDKASAESYEAGENNRKAYLKLQECERKFRDAGCDYYEELAKEKESALSRGFK